jgi:hypothetical protein
MLLAQAPLLAASAAEPVSASPVQVLVQLQWTLLLLLLLAPLVPSFRRLHHFA